MQGNDDLEAGAHEGPRVIDHEWSDVVRSAVVGKWRPEFPLRVRLNLDAGFGSVEIDKNDAIAIAKALGVAAEDLL